MSKISYNIISILKHIIFILISAIDQPPSFELYGKLEGKIFKEKFDVLKKDRIISYRKFNQHSFPKLYIFIYIPYSVKSSRIYNRNTNRFYLYSVCKHVYVLCSRSRYDSFRVPPCTRSNRWILIVFHISLPLSSCPLFKVCTPSDQISAYRGFRAVLRT